MKKFSVLFVLLIFSCNDGDIITESLEFGNTFQACGDLLLYKTNEATNETISFQITNATFTIDDLLVTEPLTTNIALVKVANETPAAIAVNGANILNYRSYTNTPINLFCNDVPQINNTLTQDFFSNTGAAAFTVSLIEDDNDGIPWQFEDKNLDLDNNPYTMPTDTDNDGIPDFLDPDDDGDNVLTINEKPNYTVEFGLANAQNTDANLPNGDAIPDYLDKDDDGDGVLTRDEENDTQDQNPVNDISNSTIGPDYLNPAIATTVPATAFREHLIGQKFTVRLNFTNINFPNIFYAEFPFGTLNSTLTTKTRSFTPEF